MIRLGDPMFRLVAALAAVSMLVPGQSLRLASAAESGAVVSAGEDLWTREGGASACATPDQVFDHIPCRNLAAFKHVRIVKEAVVEGDALTSSLPADLRTYIEYVEDDGALGFMDPFELNQFYKADPRLMAEREADENSSANSNPYVGREFWRTDDFSLIRICLTPHAAMIKDVEACHALQPGSHWKIVNVGETPDPSGTHSIFNEYYIVRGDDYSFGYIMRSDVGMAELRDTDGQAPSLHGIAWEDPRITAAKTKAVEASAKAECARRGTARIGMSEARVLASCWGSPTSKVKTILAHATREKWIYVNEEAVLYFENGVLVRIKEAE
jgi:hypothetical protein